jgi:hypothetical protein
MTVKMGDEADAFEDVIPVELLVSPETVAAYGEATDANATATETLTIPASVVPGLGGLHVELSSTAMVGLGEGARYLVEYPYGCAEQRGSRTLALVLASDLGDAFSLPGMNTAKMRPSAQQNLKDLEKFQCPDGGFSYWAGDCHFTSPYLTAYLLHVFKTAVDPNTRSIAARVAPMRTRRGLAAEQPPEGWWPSYTAWQAFAVKVLVEGGRNQDSNLTRLYGYRERMPVFGLAYLHDALVARGGAAPDATGRIADLRRRMANAILPEAGGSHVEELTDPYLLWFWNSNVRSTSIVLNSLVKADVSDAPVRQMVRWMMACGKTDGETQKTPSPWRRSSRATHRSAQPPDLPRGRQARHRGPSRARSSRAARRPRRQELSMTKVLAQSSSGRRAADVRARRHRDLFSIQRAAICLRRALSTGWTTDPDFALVCPICRRRYEAAPQLQGRRSGPRDTVLQPDEGTPLRGGHRSLPAGFEAVESGLRRQPPRSPGRRTIRRPRQRELVLVVAARRVRSRRALTTASSSSRRAASEEDATSSPTSSARHGRDVPPRPPRRGDALTEVFGRTRRR